MCRQKHTLFHALRMKAPNRIKKRNQNKNHCPPIMIRGKVSPITSNIIVFIRLLHKQIRMICIKNERFTCADCTSIWIKLSNGIITWKHISNINNTQTILNWRTKPTLIQQCAIVNFRKSFLIGRLITMNFEYVFCCVHVHAIN